MYEYSAVLYGLNIRKVLLQQVDLKDRMDKHLVIVANFMRI